MFAPTAKVNPESASCQPEQLKIFELPPTCNDIVEVRDVSIDSDVNTKANDMAGPEFSVNTGEDMFCDLSKTQLFLKFQLLSADGSIIPEKTVVGPVNNIIASLFETCEFSINETAINIPGISHCYKCYMNGALRNSAEAKNSHMSAQFWYTDSGKTWDMIDPGEVPLNIGGKTRYLLTAKSVVQTCVGKVDVDLMNTEKLMLPCKFKLKFTRTKPEFYLISNAGDKKFIIRILESKLYVRLLKMSDTYTKMINKKFSKNPTKTFATYGYLRQDLLNYNLPQGIDEISQNISKNGNYPTRLIVTLNSISRASGTIHTNPFWFIDHGANFLHVSLGGRPIPTTALSFHVYDRDNGVGDVSRIFDSLNKVLGIDNTAYGNDISVKEFIQGYFFMAVNLNELMNDDAFSPPITGTLNLQMKFATPTTEPLRMMVLIDYLAMARINGQGRVKLVY